MEAFRVEILASSHQACPSEWWVGRGGENDQKKTEVKSSHATKTSIHDKGKGKFAGTQASAAV